MLVRILTEPKNALVPQYRALLGMDQVELSFTSEALQAIAKQAMERQTGARGLRAIMVSSGNQKVSMNFNSNVKFQETLLLDPMFDVPGSEIKSVHITEECVMGNGDAIYVHHSNSTSSTDPPEGAADEEDRKYRVKQ